METDGKVSLSVSQPSSPKKLKLSSLSGKAGKVHGVSQPIGLSMADHYTVTKHLRDLSNEDLIKVGEALGLYYPDLKRMKDLPGDMVAAWLNKKDNVLSASGEPSWASLIKALRDINQPGIARKILEQC